MGVHGLWKLIDAAGKPVPVETLENKILAIDVSIWLHQLVKGFQDASGGPGANAHLLGFFYRICKLLFFRIKPVFVFDGGVPALKRNTIASRQSNRNKAKDSLEKVRQDLLQNLLKQHALGKLLGKNVKIPKTVTSKQDNMFFLPPASSSETKEEGELATSSWTDSEEESIPENEDSESSVDEYSPKKKYGDIHSIDVKSKDFKELPADMRHDILSELKETRKQNSWAKVHLMPEEMGDFSSFQMDRLLKRRSVQVGLEEAEKEMGPRCFTVTEIQEILEYQGVDVSQRIASDSTTRFLYSNFADKKDPEKGKSKKGERSGSVEELDSDIDDPVLDTLRANEDMSQEEILRLIREEETKKKAKDLIDCGKTSKNPNEFKLDEISKERLTNLDPGKNPIEPSAKKGVTFDNKQVSKLLKDSAKKNLLPISKIDKVLGGRKKKKQRKKVVRKVSAKGPDLSESSSDSDLSEKRSDRIESSGDEGCLSSTSSNNSRDNIIKTEATQSTLSSSTVSTLVSEKKSIEKSLSYSGSSDDDFEDVPTGGNLESNSNDDLTNTENSKILPQNKPNLSKKNTNGTNENQSISIELKFEKPLTDEEDMFADVFGSVDSEKINREASTPSMPILINPILSERKDIFVNEVKTLKDTVSSTKVESSTELSKDKRTIIEIKKPTSEEEMYTDVLESPKPQSSKEELKKIDSFTDGKDAERVAILEELLITKKKLEDEISPSGYDEPVKLQRRFSSDEEGEEVKKEEQISETQESLAKKEYFSGDNLVLESESNKNEKSPNSFAKQLATVEQVRQFQSTLERESSSLFKEKQSNEKIAATVSEQITVEAQELLRLFGIPYLVAPMEAEAQCAFLDLHGLTQGTITDDSDIWLFGANNVYKNFFDQKKFVKLFKSSDIKKVFNLGRDELIMLGLLVGSDYTSGLNGVGPVTALEILANFPSSDEDVFPPRDRLARFASDFTAHKLSKKLMKSLLPVQLIEGFPSLEVVKAYTDPQVDESEETFTWGNPDMESIRDYAMNKFGWDANKTDRTLEPIIDKMKQNKTQMTLHGFFDWAFDDVQNKMSKRVEAAVSLLGTSPSKSIQIEADEEEESSQEVKKVKAKRVLSEEKQSRRKRPKGTSLEAIPEAGPSCEPGPSTQPGPSRSWSALDPEEEAASFAAALDDISFAGPSSFDRFTSEPETLPKEKNQEPQLVARLPRVNATIEKLKKGKSLSAKPRVRVARESVSLFKPQSELNFDAPFGSGETRKRKKVKRTNEEKLREIEEARAKAARVLAKLKNVDQFHSNV